MVSLGYRFRTGMDVNGCSARSRHSSSLYPMLSLGVLLGPVRNAGDDSFEVPRGSRPCCAAPTREKTDFRIQRKFRRLTMPSRSTPAIVVLAASRLHLLFFSILCVPASGTLITDFSRPPLVLHPVAPAASLRNGFKTHTLATESPIIGVNHICKHIRPPTARSLWKVVSVVSQ